ncbi:MAG: glycoside hydrolase family 108 protein [Sulfobacillus sp.]
MITPFQTALAFTLPWEGGYVDNPADPGGATDKGVIQQTYNAWRTEHQLPVQSVRLITLFEADAIYKTDYWEAAHCHEFPLKLSCAVFDWAVNHGVLGAVECLQDTANVSVDGIVGPVTIEAAQKPELWKPYDQNRIHWYVKRAQTDPSQTVFLDGWINRVMALDAYLSKLP